MNMQKGPNIARYSRANGSLLIVQALSFSAGMSILIISPYSFISLGAERTMLWVMGVVGLLILTMPYLLRREFDMFEPISFVLLITLLGVTLRAIYIAAFDNDTINNDLLVGKDRGFLLPGGILILFSLMALVCGYMVKTPVLNISKFRLFRKDRWSSPRLLTVIVLFTVIGLIAMFLYLQKMGIASFVLSNISKKHFFIVEGAEYQSSALGYYRWAASLIVPAFYLYLSWFAASGRRWFSLWGTVAVLLGLLAAVFPFINSSRTGVITIIIFAMVLWHYLRRAIRIRIVIWIFAFVVAIFMIMILLRSGKGDTVSVLSSRITGEEILDRLVGNRNFFGIDKTAHIIDAVPRKLPYQYGRSLVSVVFAPVPRTVWPSKPPILLGATIGQVVYEIKDESGTGGGIPPGFVPELYINFSFPGVLIGMFMLGWWLKFVYASFRPHLQENKNACIVYVIIAYASSFQLLGGDFTAAIIDIIRVCIPIGLALWFIGGYPRSDCQNAAQPLASLIEHKPSARPKSARV